MSTPSPPKRTPPATPTKVAARGSQAASPLTSPSQGASSARTAASVAPLSTPSSPPTSPSPNPSASASASAAFERDDGGQPAWVRQQVRAFTAWMNSYLFQRDLMVEDLRTDLSDGTLLIALIEQIEAQKAAGTGTPNSPTGSAAPPPPAVFRSYNRQPKHLIQRHENLEQVLSYLRAHGQPLVGITGSTLADDHSPNKLKVVLGLMWQMILRYDINEGAQHRRIAQRNLSDEHGEGVHISITPQRSASASTAGSAKDKMLRWVEDTANAEIAKQAGPEAPRLAVQSFSALSDGCAFAHLINGLLPGTVDVAALSSTDRTANLALVFRKAEEALGIPAVVQADEFAQSPEKVDSQSLMTYLAFFKGWRPALLQRKSLKPMEQTEVQRRLLEAAEATKGHGATPSVSGSGKALDSATQLELAEAKQTIKALSSTISELQRLVASKAKEEEKVPVALTPAGGDGGAAEANALRQQVEALKQEKEDMRLAYELKIDHDSARASSASSSPTTSSPASPSAAVEAKKVSIVESALKSALAKQKEVQQKFAASEQTLAEMTRTLEATNAHAKALEAHVARVEQEKAAVEAKQQQQTDTASAALKANLFALQAELEKARAQAASNTTQQSELAQKAQEAEKRAAALQAEAAQAVKAKEELQLNYERKLDEMEQSRAQSNAQASAEAEATKAQLKTLEAVMATQLATAQEAAYKQSEHDRALAELNQTLSSSNAKAQQLAEQATALEAAKAQAEAQRSQAQEELKREMSKAQAQLKANQQQQSAVASKAQNTDTQMAALEKRIAAVQDEKDDLRAQYEQRLTAYESKEQTWEAERAEHAEQQPQVAELEKAMQAALSKAKESAARQSETERALSDLRASSTAATGQAKALEAQVARLEAEKKANAAQVQKLQQELTSTSALVKESQQRQAEQSKRIEAATAVAASTVAAGAGAGAAELQALRKERDALQAQVKQLQSKLAAAPAPVAADSVTAAQLQERERQVAELEKELAEVRSRSTSASAPAPSAVGDGGSATLISQLRAQHAFDLKALDKEKEVRIAALNERIHALEAASKTVRASERERDEEREGWERRVHDADEEIKTAREALRKERLRAEQALAEKRAAEDSRKKGEDELRARLEEAKETMTLQRKEAQEGAALKKERAEQERRLGEERRKNRDLLQRIEQIKRNREEVSDSRGAEAQRSLSQRSSRRPSRATSPIPPSHGRSFSSAPVTGEDTLGSSLEEEKLPVVSATATTDEDDDAQRAPPPAAAKGKRKKGKGKQGEGQLSLSTLQPSSSTTSVLINVAGSAPSSRSPSRTLSPRTAVNTSSRHPNPLLSSLAPANSNSNANTSTSTSTSQSRPVHLQPCCAFLPHPRCTNLNAAVLCSAVLYC